MAKELPFGWIYKNKTFTDKISGEWSHFLDTWIASRSKGILGEYAALKSLVKYIEDARVLCSKQSNLHRQWSDEIIADETYYQRRKAELLDIENNIDSLLETEKRKKEIETPILPQLKSRLLQIIASQPGILQTDIVELFEADTAEYIKTELYYMEKDSVIVREKQGRTYKLFVK